MVTDKSTSTASGVVAGVHRAVRRLAPDDGPFPGALVTVDGGVAVASPVDDTPATAWEHAGAEHVAGVVDIIRTHAGHDAILPWCTERLRTLVERRAQADDPLSAGESGTVVASLLRGLVELGRRDPEPLGTWWRTDDGRPLFVHDERASTSAGAEAQSLIEAIAEPSRDRSLSRVLHAAAELCIRTRVTREETDAVEAELFELAVPRELVASPTETGPFVGDEASRAVATAAFARATAGDEGEQAWERDAAGRVARGTFAGHRATGIRQRFLSSLSRALPMTGGADRRDGASPAVGAAPVRRKTEGDGLMRSSSPTRAVAAPRRRPLLIAAGAAAVVLLGGVLWPAPPSSEAHGTDSAVTEGTSGAPSVGPGPGAREAAEASRAAVSSGFVDRESGDEAAAEDGAQDALRALPGLLDAIRACRDGGVMRCAAIAVGELPERGLAVAGADAVEPSLIEDYGDIAVIRLDPVTDAEGPAQMMVLVRSNNRWLVRDVYDVAHQPSEG